ncbi:tachykinins-like [Eriocheir sinensis]|uniref:tachykinins-like n=1 Tax=Eriocheir sinensis TaxID=95602 RepID=UPI0021C6D1E0|nr:tachykinins-like [Eriocheir sinensis]
MARMWVYVAVVVLGVAAAAAGGGGQGGEGGRPCPCRPLRLLGHEGKKEAPHPHAGWPCPSDDMMPGLYQLDMPLRGKKTPSGCLGMRGKKSEDEEDDMDEEEEEAVYGRPALDSDFNFLLKRAPSGFLGMRGKKAPSV